MLGPTCHPVLYYSLVREVAQWVLSPTCHPVRPMFESHQRIMLLHKTLTSLLGTGWFQEKEFIRNSATLLVQASCDMWPSV